MTEIATVNTDISISGNSHGTPVTPQFDAVVGNPPYQDSGNGAIFHMMHNVAMKAGRCTSLIYPGGKWVRRSGKGGGLDEFSITMLNSPFLMEIVYFSNVRSVFPGVEMEGGLTVVNTDETANNDQWKLTIESKTKLVNHPGKMVLSLDFILDPIITRMKEHAFTPLSELITVSKTFGFDSFTVERNPELFTPCEKYDDDPPGYPSIGYLSPMTTGVDVVNSNSHGVSEYGDDAAIDLDDGDTYVKVLTNAKSGPAGKSRWFWIQKKNMPRQNDLLYRWKIVISSRNTSGDMKKNQNLEILPPMFAYSGTRFCVADFPTEKECENFVKWFDTAFVRVLLAASSKRIKNFGVNVPTEADYTDENPLFRHEDINETLMDRYNLTDAEKAYITLKASALLPLRSGNHHSHLN